MGIAIILFVISFFLGVYAYTLHKKEVQEKKEKREKRIQEERDKYYDKLTELQNLKAKNIITQEEFEREKEKIKYVKI